MSKTLKVLSDRHRLADDLVAAGEVLNMRYPPGKDGLSLRAAKLLHRLIAEAGPDAGQPMRHSFPIARLNDFHVSKAEFYETCAEVFWAVVTLEVTNSKGKKSLQTGPFLSDLIRDVDDDGDITFELSPVMRRVMATSDYWAVLSRKAVMAFQSRYSLRLYELVSLRVGLDKVQSETFELDEIRKRFGVPDGKLKTWQALKEKVLETAIAEVSHLTGLMVRYEPVKRGKAVSGVKLIWREKNRQQRAEAAKELDRSSVGRAVRRAGKAEQIVQDAAEREEVAAGLRALASNLGHKLRADDPNGGV